MEEWLIGLVLKTSEVWVCFSFRQYGSWSHSGEKIAVWYVFFILKREFYSHNFPRSIWSWTDPLFDSEESAPSASSGLLLVFEHPSKNFCSGRCRQYGRCLIWPSVFSDLSTDYRIVSGGATGVIVDYYSAISALSAPHICLWLCTETLGIVSFYYFGTAFDSRNTVAWAENFCCTLERSWIVEVAMSNDERSPGGRTLRMGMRKDCPNWFMIAGDAAVMDVNVAFERKEYWTMARRPRRDVWAMMPGLQHHHRITII